MSDVKISQLPASTTPLAGTELVPIVQSGVTKQTTVAGFTTASAGYTPSGTGAVARSVASKLQESVSVKDFGAVGDGVTDDTAAIQAAMNTGLDVVFPDTNYKITASLIVGSQRLIGKGRAVSRNRYQSQITVIGDIPAFINSTTSWVSFEIDGFFIFYSDTLPTVPTGNNQKTAFYFTSNSGKYPEYYHIKNCTVLGAWQGLVDTSDSYMSKLTQVVCRMTKRGFYKLNGTTIEFDTCSSANGEQAFSINYCLGAVLTNCSADFLTVTASTFDQAGVKFDHVPSLVISAFDAENNSVSGAGTRFMFFDTVQGSVNGFTGANNTMSCAAGQEVYWFNPTASSYVTFNGVKLDYTAGWLAFTGVAGKCYTLATSGYCNLTLIASNFAAPTGGTPTDRYSVAAFTGASISLIDTYTNELTTGIGFSTKSGTTQVCEGSWDNGPMKMGSYYLWIDASGNLRIKSSAPTWNGDGTVVGTQT